jgi:hypothetical protein
MGMGRLGVLGEQILEVVRRGWYRSCCEGRSRRCFWGKVTLDGERGM